MVKNLNMFDQRFAQIMDPTDDLLSGKVAINYNRNVSLDGRKAWQRLRSYSARSILKQFIEVKFKYQHLRGIEALRNVRM